MMKRLNIGIDIDGTVTEAFYWLKRANEFFGTALTEDSIVHYEYHRSLGQAKQDCDLFYSLFGETIHWEAEIRPGAQYVINRLFRDHYIHFVTARDERMRQVSLNWLDKQRIPMDSISLLGSYNKVGQAKELKCDLFIEDRYENAIQLSRDGIDVLLMDCSYNRHKLPSNVMRVTNWYQIGNLIRELDYGLFRQEAL